MPTPEETNVSQLLRDRTLGGGSTIPSVACDLADAWIIEPRLAEAIVRLAETIPRVTGRDLWIISGYRTVREQIELREQGRPAADPDRSNHTTCPAGAVDVWLGALPTDGQRFLLGREARLVGLRWGGGSPVDPETGIPSDWNHLDFGPRR